MKKIITFWFVLITVFSFSQTISTLKMGDIKIEMTLNELSKIVGEEIKLKKDKYGYAEDVKINHKGVNYTVSFMQINNEERKESIYVISRVSSSDAKLKTLSNVGVGSTLDDLWGAYKNNWISIYRAEDDKTEDSSKIERIFSLSDIEAQTFIKFYIKNNKVTLIEIGILEDGC